MKGGGGGRSRLLQFPQALNLKTKPNLMDLFNKLIISFVKFLL